MFGSGCVGGEWIRGLDLVCTTHVGTRGVLDVSIIHVGFGPGSGRVG